MKKILLLIMAAICLVGCSEDGKETKLIKIAFKDSNMSIKSKDSRQLDVIRTPNDGNSAHEYIWTSSNTYAVLVRDGLITGRSPGVSEITATAVSGHVATCTVTVVPIEATGISMGMDVIELHIDETEKIQYAISPSNADNKDVIWSIKDPSIATIEDNGKVTGVAIGETEATVTVKGSSVSNKCIIKVVPAPITGIVCDKEVALLVGSTKKINYSVLPKNATCETIEWYIENPEIATIDQNGNVSGVSLGNTKVTVKPTNLDIEALCNVTICEIDQLVTTSTGVGTEGSSGSGYYSYIKLNFATNSEQVYIRSIILTDENYFVRNADTDIGNVKTFSKKFVTKQQSGSIMNTYPAKGWIFTITYVWRGKEYVKVVINK